MMIEIAAGLKVNWAHVLFQVLLNIVNTSKHQSQGFAIQISALLQHLVKENLGESVTLHPQKALTRKSVQTYIKKNSETKAAGESRRKMKIPLETTSAPSLAIMKKRRTMRTRPTEFSIANQILPQPEPVSSNPMDNADLFLTEIPKGTPTHTNAMEDKVSDNLFTPTEPFDKSERNLECEIQMDYASPHIAISLNVQGEKERSIPDYLDKETTSITARASGGIHSADVNNYSIDKGTTTANQAETKEIKELMQRRSLLLYKSYELEVQNLFDEKLENFTDGVPSARHDFLCLRFLHKALRDITIKHQAQRVLAGASRGTIHQIVQQINEDTTNTYSEHQAPVYEQSIPQQEYQAQSHTYSSLSSSWDEDGEDGRGLSSNPSSPGSPTLSGKFLVHSSAAVHILGPDVSSAAHINMDQQNPQSSVMPIVTSARMKIDTDLTRHHTTLLRDQLKSSVDGLEIKIDVLENTLSRKLVDSQQNFVVLKTTMKVGNDKKGEGGQSRPREGLNRPGEGTSDGQSSIRGRGPSPRGGKGSSSREGRGMIDKPVGRWKTQEPTQILNQLNAKTTIQKLTRPSQKQSSA
ncbi:hypothetical protein F511_28115 [Dorcoceras hygrometricum]|uniref:Uncharacterized protein n=1 Tax=Dorcoceras hygrometricum TaxID=472368 RepID=A0A2Z7BGQ2_9LAMI|nr:hypothetical protein F511_28115 [Dorcoceras hygrometricum]